jgi:hypothetical protein
MDGVPRVAPTGARHWFRAGIVSLRVQPDSLLAAAAALNAGVVEAMLDLTCGYRGKGAGP